MKNIVRKNFVTMLIIIALLTTLTMPAMAEYCAPPTQPPVEGVVQTPPPVEETPEEVPVQTPQPELPAQPVLPITQQAPCAEWITMHWLEAELYKLGIDDFELKLESSMSPEKDYILELIVSFPIEEGHTCKVFTQIKDGELMVRDGYLLFPKGIGEFVISTIKWNL